MHGVAKALHFLSDLIMALLNRHSNDFMTTVLLEKRRLIFITAATKCTKYRRRDFKTLILIIQITRDFPGSLCQNYLSIGSVVVCVDVFLLFCPLVFIFKRFQLNLNSTLYITISSDSYSLVRAIEILRWSCKRFFWSFVFIACRFDRNCNK